MPLYEYKCPECGKVFEDRKTFEEYLSTSECPACGTPSKRAITPMIIHWGVGFKPAGRNFHTPDGSAKKARKMWDHS